jgi:dTDP-4-dehydrorhamnose 3,5-epimerase
MTAPEVRPLELEGLLEIRPRRFGDERGFFSEVWRDDWLGELGLGAAQDKLVRVARGSIFDVALDVRSASPTFGKWAGIVLSAEEWNQLFIPKGFAHGFVTLEDETEVLYKVSDLYSPAHDRAIRFDDPAVGIAWPVDPASITVSEKDRTAPLLAEIEPEL